MKFTKIISIALCIVLLLAMFAGCQKENEAEVLLKKAGLQMLDKQFAMTMTMDYSCDDAELDAALSAVSASKIEMIVDGKNVKMDMTVLDQKVTVLCVNEVVYMDMFGMKVKSFLEAEDYAEMFGEINEMADMDLEEFKSVEIIDNADGGKTVICHGFDDDLASALTENAGDLDEILNIEIKEDSAKVTIVLDKNGNFASISLDMTMVMLVLNRGDVTVDASLDYAFDYTKGEKLSYPADADQYGTIDPDWLTQ